VDTLFVIRGRVLLVGDEEIAHAAGDGMVRVGDLDLEPLQWTVADVSSSNEVEIGTLGGIQPHRVVEVEEPSTPFDE
jgi:hypothetical protein